MIKNGTGLMNTTARIYKIGGGMEMSLRDFIELNEDYSFMVRLRDRNNREIAEEDREAICEHYKELLDKEVIGFWGRDDYLQIRIDYELPDPLPAKKYCVSVVNSRSGQVYVTATSRKEAKEKATELCYAHKIYWAHEDITRCDVEEVRE